MMTTPTQVARRYVHANAFVRLDPIPVVLGDSGVITASDLEHLLELRGIEAHDVRIRRGRRPNEFRWEGRDSGGQSVRGRLSLYVGHDPERVVVSASIVLASVVTTRPPSETPGR